MKKVKFEFVQSEVFSEAKLLEVETKLDKRFPPIMVDFYKEHYSLEFDGNKMFEADERNNTIKGYSDLEVSVHKTILFDNLVEIYTSEFGLDGYEELFGKYWTDYLPIIAPLGCSGYFLVGTEKYNLDKIILLAYADNTIIEVCNDVFEFFNEHLIDY